MSDALDAHARLALTNLADLIPAFQEDSKHFPELRHSLVEPMPGCEQSPADPIPAFTSGSVKWWDQDFYDDRPPGRTHYYSGIDRDDDGAELERFRDLATRAARCVEWWPAGTPGMPDDFDSAVEFRPRHRAEDRHREGWTVLLHRVAWRREAGSPLRAKATRPDVRYPPAGPWDGEYRPGTTNNIPAHCFHSTLLPDVFDASVQAIRIIMALAKTGTTPTPDSGVPGEDADDMTPCQRDVLAVIGEGRKRLVTDGVIAALNKSGRSHGESTVKLALAKLNKRDRLLINCSKCKPRGYGLPGWPCSHQPASV